MGRKNSSSAKKELAELIEKYEAAKAENHQLYMDGDQLADIADWYAAEQKFKEAQEVITYGLLLHPGNTDLLVEQAYLYMDTRKIQKAKQVADTITEEYNSEVKMLKAELMLNEGKLEEAQQLLSTIENANELPIISDIMYLYLDLGYPEAAKEWLDRGKARYAEMEDYLIITGDYLATTHQNEAAIEVFNKLIDKAPYNASYWMGLAKCLFVDEKADKAIEACDFALAADEKCGEAYAYKAHSFFYLNNLDDAIENYQKAIEYKSIPPELGYMFMGLSYASKEEWQKADECYDKVIEIFEKDSNGVLMLLVDTYNNKAVALSHLGRLEEAHQFCDKAKKINPNEGLIYLTDGKLYLEEELDDEAEAAFKKALEVSPGVEMCYMIASSYSDNNYLCEAQEYFEMAYELNPKYENLAEKLSILSLMLNEVDNFFKYNSECEHPISSELIQDLLSSPEHREEDEKTLKEVLKRMKKENKKKGNNESI